MARNISTRSIKRFRGLNSWGTAMNVSPDWASDLKNVLVSGSGGLEKLRYPTDLAEAVGDLSGQGNIFAFQTALGVRQLLGMFGDRFYKYELSDYTATLLDTHALNEGILSAVTSNNIAFMANGLRMMKWTGTEFQKWGIAQLQAPSRTVAALSAIDNPLDAPVLGTVAAATYVVLNIWYDISFSWVNANGETLDSPVSGIAIGEDNELVTVTPGPAPAGATGWNVYVGYSDVPGAPRHKVNAEPIPASQTVFTQPEGNDWITHTLDPLPPVANTTDAGGITLTSGRRYRAAAGNAAGHIGAASEASVSTGAVSNTQAISVFVLNPADPQCDRIWLFSTVDGGADYYLHQNPNSEDGSWPLDISGVTTIVDMTTDDTLNLSIIAPTLNFPAPVGNYVCEWGGRLYVFNLDGSPQDIAFSGYERIYIGRPEESFPPNNRLRLALGADAIRGGGVIQAGVVAFSRSNEMFMLRGTVTDRSTDAPIEYLAELEKLPWNTGCASHFSIARTPYGLIWLASDKTIKIFNGVAEPITLAMGMIPILRTITPGTEEDARGVFFCFLEREWYLLLCAAEGSTQKNRILIVDLDQDAEKNVGGFVLDIQADAMELIEDANGTTHLVILQEGILKELRILSDTTSGVSLEYAATENILPAYWRSGYFETDTPEWMKLFRFARIVTDQLGFQVQVYLVDNESMTFRNPGIVPFTSALGKVQVNRKARFAAVEIKFPEEDTAANVVELSLSHFKTSTR